MKLEDLPPAARARLAARNPHLAETLKSAKSSKGARPAGRSLTTGGRWACPRCPELPPFDTWAAVERHRDEMRHGRFEIVTTPAPPPELAGPDR